MISIDSFNSELKGLINEATVNYNKGQKVEIKSRIPTANVIPLGGDTWWRINDVTCVFIDMKNSTQLSASKYDQSTASIYQYFTGTAVRILNYFDAAYIDVKGDGAFGLFNSNRVYHALAAGITYKTFCTAVLSQTVKLENQNKVSCHIGIDRKTVLVKRVGIRTKESQIEKDNEVWAGKPVNMAAKLASLGGENDLIVSDRFFSVPLKDASKMVLRSCENDEPLWDTMELNTDNRFDFAKAYRLKSPGWCSVHGKDFCEKIISLDK